MKEIRTGQEAAAHVKGMPRISALIRCVVEGKEQVSYGKVYLLLDETFYNYVFTDDQGETAMLAKECFELFQIHTS